MKLNHLSMTLRSLAAIIMIPSLNGCVSYVPPDNADFSEVKDLGQLCGTYKNHGDAERFDPSNQRIYRLSALLWNSYDTAGNDAIAKIKISRVDETALRIMAIDNDGETLKTRSLKLDKDFKLKDGRIILYQKCEGLAPSGLGLFWTSQLLGLDEHNNGKLKERRTIAGLLICCIPMVMTETEEVRFARLDKPGESTEREAERK